MPLGSATLQAPPEVFALGEGGTAATTVQVAADGKIVWDDASTDDLTPGTTAVLSAYDGSATFDTTAFAWLVFAVKGAAPLVLKESDFPANVESLLSGATWLPLRRIDGPRIQRFSSSGGFPAGTTGDILYFDGTSWVVLHAT